MEPLAEMTCVLKVNVHCDICKMKVMQVLQNLHGVYSVVIEGDKGTVEIAGKVNPYRILTALDSNSKHAKVSSLKFDGEVEQNSYNYYEGHGYFPPRMTYPYPVLRPEFSYSGRCPQFIPPPVSLVPPLPMWPRPPPPIPPPVVSPPPPSMPPPVVSNSTSEPPQAEAPSPSKKPERCSIM